MFTDRVVMVEVRDSLGIFLLLRQLFINRATTRSIKVEIGKQCVRYCESNYNEMYYKASYCVKIDKMILVKRRKKRSDKSLKGISN